LFLSAQVYVLVEAILVYAQPMAGGSAKSVIAAVIGNGTVAVLKLFAFAVSGSGAMLAEGIHSVADTANQALLYLGIRRSQRPATEQHPYGFGAERYFWSLVSAMGIFVLGCGVTVYHGVEQLLHPTLPVVGWLTWAVLVISAILQGGVFAIAVRQANAQKGDQGLISYLKGSSDPTLIAVLLEDTIAVAGIGIAAAGIGLAMWTGIPHFDGAASILIGLLLGVLALLLAIKNKSLLIGRSATPEVEAQIRKLVIRDPSVAKIVALRTRVLAAGEHRVDLQVDFDPEAIIDRLIAPYLDNIPVEAPEMEKVLRDFGRRLIDDLALEVDRLEDKIRQEIPSVTLIDIEGD